ncbi:MAG: elongation factor P maturation arginine rhamnosyltransferase EarP [Rubrivivax sp.]|nr:elongation factor P maturation arginine rhamnosyltransferase EarP [Rubrivivax sp.]
MPGAPMERPSPSLRWDLYCRVVDNFGDVGVCWRLATQLAALGDTVRLVTDDPSALAWMAPPGARPAGVSVWPWPGPAGVAAPIVVEAFGCELPAATLEAMRRTDPVWINLEYLSAETYVERSHGLPSPRSDGLRKWFFYPGFTPGTGGLLREPGLAARRAAFDRDAWLRVQGVPRREGERVATLFCYDNPALDALRSALADAPTLLLLTPGPAQRLVPQGTSLPGHLRTAALPWLSQEDFDHLLWSSDLNAVRGEDSFVRGLWAGAAMLWQAYPQHDAAHKAKVEAAIGQLALPSDVGAAWRAWNGMAPWRGLPALAGWQPAIEAARDRLWRQDDLVTQLRHFAIQRLRG